MRGCLASDVGKLGGGLIERCEYLLPSDIGLQRGPHPKCREGALCLGEPVAQRGTGARAPGEYAKLTEYCMQLLQEPLWVRFFGHFSRVHRAPHGFTHCRQTGGSLRLAHRALDHLESSTFLQRWQVSKHERRLEQIEHVAVIRARGAHMGEVDQAHHRRSRTGSGKPPATFIFKQQLIALQQGTQPARSGAIKRDDSDVAHACTEPSVDLLCARTRLRFERTCRKNRNAA